MSLPSIFVILQLALSPLLNAQEPGTNPEQKQQALKLASQAVLIAYSLTSQVAQSSTVLVDETVQSVPTPTTAY